MRLEATYCETAQRSARIEPASCALAALLMSHWSHAVSGVPGERPRERSCALSHQLFRLWFLRVWNKNVSMCTASSQSFSLTERPSNIPRFSTCPTHIYDGVPQLPNAGMTLSRLPSCAVQCNEAGVSPQRSNLTLRRQIIQSSSLHLSENY